MQDGDGQAEEKGNGQVAVERVYQGERQEHRVEECRIEDYSAFFFARQSPA